MLIGRGTLFTIILTVNELKLMLPIIFNNNTNRTFNQKSETSIYKRLKHLLLIIWIETVIIKLCVLFHYRYWELDCKTVSASLNKLIVTETEVKNIIKCWMQTSSVCSTMLPKSFSKYFASLCVHATWCAMKCIILFLHEKTSSKLLLELIFSFTVLSITQPLKVTQSILHEVFGKCSNCYNMLRQKHMLKFMPCNA